MYKSNVKLKINTVIKTGPPPLMRVEVEKNLRAYEIAQRCGLFQVPRVLDFDETTGQAVFDRLHDVQPIRDILAFESNNDSIVQTLGESLATIHKELILPDEMKIPLPTELDLKNTEVFIHGDLTVNNIFVGPDYRPLYILDWQMTKKHGENATYGTRYFDLAWFTKSLFDRPFHHYMFSNPITPVARTFLVSYFKKTDFPFHGEQFRQYMNQFFDTVISFRKSDLSWELRLSLMPSDAKFRKFVSSFHI